MSAFGFGAVFGFLAGCAYWAFITWKTGLVGDDDQHKYGRQS